MENKFGRDSQIIQNPNEPIIRKNSGMKNYLKQTVEAELTEERALEEDVGVPGKIKKIKEEITILEILLKNAKGNMEKEKEIRAAILKNEQKIKNLIKNN